MDCSKCLIQMKLQDQYVTFCRSYKVYFFQCKKCKQVIRKQLVNRPAPLFF